MLAVRKLPPKTVSQWEAANLNSASFEDLSITLIREWIDDNNQVSIYVVDALERLVEVAMGLSMVTGGGPKGASFFVVPLGRLKTAGLTMHQTDGKTLCPMLDKLHYDVSVRKGGDLKTLISTFVEHGEIRAADQMKVRGSALHAVRQGDYDLPKLASDLKNPVAANEVQKVCNSAFRLVGSGDLTIS